MFLFKILVGLNINFSPDYDDLEKLVKRGEKVELLIDKTHKMKHQAFKFESTVGSLYINWRFC